MNSNEFVTEKNKVEKGVLYIVGTPIGNTADITERALKVLEKADFIAAEDTRNSGKLLSMYGIKQNYVSYHEHNKSEAGNKIIERIKLGETCALITDAGMPGISDPGEDLVKLCYENGIKVTSTPGPTAFATALVLSGLPIRRFCFEGFLEGSNSEKKKALERVKNDTRTVIFYEAPHRLKATLSLMNEIFGNRNIALAREITKLNEEIIRTTLEGAISLYSEKEPRGEYVLVVEGSSGNSEILSFDNMTIEEHIQMYIDGGMKKMDAIKAVAKDRNVPKSEIYDKTIKK